MKVSEYQKLAVRTCNDLGSRDLNRQHMLLGVISEIGELADAYKKELAYGKILDKVNIMEEWADLMWYGTNWATFNNVILKDRNYLNEDDYFLLDLTIFFNNDVPDEDPIDILFTSLQIMDFSKYEEFVDLLFSLGKHLNLSFEEMYKALDNNIAKLQIRFPDKFTKENALNRNLEEERKQLEK